MNTITIVTCYYKIKSKRTHECYVNYINNFFNNISANIVVYTSKEDSKLLSKFQNDKIKIVIKEFNQIELYKKYSNIMKKQYEMDNQKNTGRTYQCYILWNSKLDFLKEAIETNPFNSDKFMWLDIGSIRTQDTIDILKTFPTYENISKNKIDIVYLKKIDNQNQKFFQDEIHFGGLYGGGIEPILKFHELFYKKFQEYVNNNRFIGCDQQIISSVYLENKDLFNAINPHCDNLTENNKLIPIKMNIDVWFYLIYYYSHIL